ncbi:MAG: DUF6265 family protein [Flavobacteriales bacterium]|nr:DUF6265 family protein [Flavobacteriales bacterium]
MYAQKSTEIERFRWLEGVWQCTESPQNYERWSWKDATLKGVGYQVELGVEKIFEWLEITQVDGKLVYRVHIQKSGKRTDFVLERKGSKYVFINPQNDFPQVIIYQKINSKKYKVVLSMLQSNGKNNTSVLTFTKVKAKSWHFN